MHLLIRILGALFFAVSPTIAQEYDIAIIPTEGLDGTLSTFGAKLNDRCEATVTVQSSSSSQDDITRRVLLRRGVPIELGRTVNGTESLMQQGFSEIVRPSNNGVIVGNSYSGSGALAAVQTGRSFQALPAPEGQSQFLVRGANNHGEFVGAGFDD